MKILPFSQIFHIKSEKNCPPPLKKYLNQSNFRQEMEVYGHNSSEIFYMHIKEHIQLILENAIPGYNRRLPKAPHYLAMKVVF